MIKASSKLPSPFAVTVEEVKARHTCPVWGQKQTGKAEAPPTGRFQSDLFCVFLITSCEKPNAPVWVNTFVFGSKNTNSTNNSSRNHAGAVIEVDAHKHAHAGHPDLRDGHGSQRLRAGPYRYSGP